MLKLSTIQDLFSVTEVISQSESFGFRRNFLDFYFIAPSMHYNGPAVEFVNVAQRKEAVTENWVDLLAYSQ